MAYSRDTVPLPLRTCVPRRLAPRTASCGQEDGKLVVQSQGVRTLCRQVGRDGTFREIKNLLAPKRAFAPWLASVEQ